MKANSDREYSTANQPVFTLSIASRLSGIPSHSIRQYIDRGLLIPMKLDSNRHLFSASDVSRLRLVNKMIREKGLNITGIRALMASIPCWAIKPCTVAERESCGAYYQNAVPCWEASDKNRRCMNSNCRECDVYDSICTHGDVKTVIRNLIN